MTKNDEFGDGELLSVFVPFGRKRALLLSLINNWALSVLTFRAITFGVDGYNPTNRTPDDFVGALFLRQAIEDGLHDLGKAGPMPILAAIDDLHCISTAPDDRGYVLQLAAGPSDADLARPAWWWHRYPARGALFEPARRWYIANGFDPPTVD